MRPSYFAGPLLAELSCWLAARLRACHVVWQLLFRVQIVLEKLADFIAALDIGGAAFFDIGGAEIDIAVDVFRTFADQIGEFAYRA